MMLGACLTPKMKSCPPLCAGDSDYRLPALLLCNLEIGNGSGVWVVEAGPDYLCLGADNKLYQVCLLVFLADGSAKQ